MCQSCGPLTTHLFTAKASSRAAFPKRLCRQAGERGRSKGHRRARRGCGRATTAPAPPTGCIRPTLSHRCSVSIMWATHYAPIHSQSQQPSSLPKEALSAGGRAWPLEGPQTRTPRLWPCYHCSSTAYRVHTAHIRPSLSHRCSVSIMWATHYAPIHSQSQQPSSLHKEALSAGGRAWPLEGPQTRTPRLWPCYHCSSTAYTVHTAYTEPPMWCV